MRAERSRSRATRGIARALGRRAALVALGFAAPVLALELVLRLLPVSAGNAKLPVSAADPVPHYPPRSEIVWSLGWDFARVVRKRTNEAGFFSDVEYERSADEPVLAVIGDSYVEAMQVENDAAADALLRLRPEARGRVYAFGVSGAPLSQYLGFADVARRSYGADAMVFVVVGNDFDESHERYRTTAGGSVFAEDPGGGELELRVVEHEAGFVRRMARRSALLRYLTFNARVDWDRALRFGEADEPADADVWVGNTAAAADEERIETSLRVLDRFFALLPARAGLPPERIAFVLDGMRPDLYDPARLARAEGSYFGRMRRAFAERARAAGYEVIDLQPVFARRHASDGERFEVAGDGHWNELGHAVAAEAIAGSALWRETFNEPSVLARALP